MLCQSIYKEKLQSVAEQRPPVTMFWVEGDLYHVALQVTDTILLSSIGENRSVLRQRRSERLGVKFDGAIYFLHGANSCTLCWFFFFFVQTGNKVHT